MTKYIFNRNIYIYIYIYIVIPYLTLLGILRNVSSINFYFPSSLSTLPLHIQYLLPFDLRIS